MAKYYVRSGRVRHLVTAFSPLAAAVRTFQWTCEQQANIEAGGSVELVRQAEQAGCLMGDEVHVSERGFTTDETISFDINLVVDHWQHEGRPTVVPQWIGAEAVA